MRAVLLVAILLVPRLGLAVSDVAEDGDAYCAWQRGITNSQSALVMAPQVFVDYGVVNGNDVTTGAGGTTTLPPTHRLTLGIRYSFVGLAAGIIDRQRATAECARYRATSLLNRLLTENREQVSPASLDARLAILRGALPRAREIVRALRMAVEHAHATVEELHAVELRAQTLEADEAQATALRAGLPSRSSLPSPETLLEKHVQAELEVERYEARLRQAHAFDLSFRWGYDQFFGLRDTLPLFAVVSLTINPAAVYQPVAEAEARRARPRWVRAQNEGIDQKVELLSGRLRAVLTSERQRLEETRVLLADVEGRLRAIESIENERLRRVRDAIWFDWVTVKAEHEFLRVHVAELSATLEGGR